MYTGLIPSLKVTENDETIYLWFNDIIVRECFIQKVMLHHAGDAIWKKEHIHIDDIDQTELMMGKFIFKAKKKKSKTVPLMWVYDFYQQAVGKAVDKS